MSKSTEDVRAITSDEYVNKQGPAAEEKYRAYTSTYGLRVAMEMLEADDIQEVKGKREIRKNHEDIGTISQSSASNFLNGHISEVTSVRIDFDKAEIASAFNWTATKSVLDEPNTVYDIPLERLVIRFADEEFENMWKSKIESAISDTAFPTDWIEPPFFAVLTSGRPDEQGREKVKDDHENHYFNPRSNESAGRRGLGWRPRVLDLDAVWSAEAQTEGTTPKFEAWAERVPGNWDPKRLEYYLMNYFEEDEGYTGMLFDQDLMNTWRRAVSTEYSSSKTFQWQDDEHWVLQE